MTDGMGPGAKASGAFSRHGTYVYEVRGTDTDQRDRLHMHALFSMMQEAAALHAERLGFGAQQFDPQGITWVLLRVSVRMDSFPAWKERFTIETWPSGTDRLYGLRDFRFFREDGTPAGAATTTWLVVDTATRRPRRFVPPAAEGQTTATGATEASDAPPDRSLAFDAPKVDADDTMAATAPVLRHVCRASDIDRNLHVNNTRYIAWCLDALQTAVGDPDPVVGIDMNYLSELRLSEEALLTVGTPSDGEALVEGRRSDGSPVFRARLFQTARDS